MKTIGLAAALAGLGLAACGEGMGDPQGGSSEAGRPPEATSSVTAPEPVVDAIRCWGLTQGASVFHRAAPERAGELPEVSIETYTAWFNEALRLASAAGLNQDQFQTLQCEYQMSNRFAVDAELRAQSVEAINACLARTPTDTSEPPQLPQG